MYYSLSGGTLPHGPGGRPVRANFLLRSADLANWVYLHPFVEDDQYTLVGDGWRVSLFLAHRRQTYPPILQSHERRTISTWGLR